ncbi:MAG: 50S ribosomal protein L6 [Lentisphaerae bacterium]|nr:50S ribosomal protein L6 [Lentisphaerota bacterium]
MSRVGRSPVPIAKGVTVTVAGASVTVKGALGELSVQLPDKVQASVEADQVKVVSLEDSREGRSLHGLARNMIANMIEGVSKGYSKKLLIEGVGFKVALQGKGKMALSLGFASPVQFDIPDGIKVTEQEGVKMTVSGMDKQLVGDTAARIRSFFPAEPYKGKGIRYEGEHVKRKVGKTVA